MAPDAEIAPCGSNSIASRYNCAGAGLRAMSETRIPYCSRLIEVTINSIQLRQDWGPTTSAVRHKYVDSQKVRPAADLDGTLPLVGELSG